MRLRCRRRMRMCASTPQSSRSLPLNRWQGAGGRGQGAGRLAMAITRREAISISGSTLAGLSLGAVTGGDLLAQATPAQEPWSDQLVERPLRDGFPAPLPLNADGSAPEHPASEAGPITTPLMWKTANRQAPAIEVDYQK